MKMTVVSRLRRAPGIALLAVGVLAVTACGADEQAENPSAGTAPPGAKSSSAAAGKSQADGVDKEFCTKLPKEKVGEILGLTFKTQQALGDGGESGIACDYGLKDPALRESDRVTITFTNPVPDAEKFLKAYCDDLNEPGAATKVQPAPEVGTNGCYVTNEVKTHRVRGANKARNVQVEAPDTVAKAKLVAMWKYATEQANGA